MSIEDVKDGSGQTARLLLKLPSGAECEIYLFGATVTKFKTASGKDLIWLSSTAKLDGTKAIRGGIPLVFPQFGQPIKEMAQHGFARNNTWKETERSCTATSVSVTLTLDESIASHDAWKFPYRLEFEVVMQDSTLSTSLKVVNTGAESFKFQCLQHTYLNIADIGATCVTGLLNERFLDKTAADPTALNIDSRATADIKEFTDRVYVNVNSRKGDKVLVKCPVGTIGVAGKAYFQSADASIPSDTVMWNPWEEKAKGMGDFDDDGYLKMLCIEPGLIADFHVLPAGGVMCLHQVLSLEDADTQSSCCVA
eukprot:TRINITY_DN37752_c0_g1_i1.p1 TRINITY_DN37752_c0_g1~~TRINITY_DN37752_c0_g1_i1.p1  ORF type:complete len:328 (-),score=80.69 TRINITY_DN37752_c0_g1_i1:35-964(-)